MTDDDLVEAVRARVADRELPPPATPEDVAAVEAAVGHPMPQLLRRLYLEVANGGFGVWECLSLTDTGNWFSDERDMIEAHRQFSTEGDSSNAATLQGIVPLMDRGCCMWTLIDFSTADGRVWDWDANDCCVLVPTTLTLARWLTGWLEGWIVPGPYSEFRIHADDCGTGQPSAAS
ncbi:SMI1/KNR4 family protein [Streptomyces sp. NPDC004376]